MDRGHGGATASHHRLRDYDDGIARWLEGEPPDQGSSATEKFVNRTLDATAMIVRVHIGS